MIATQELRLITCYLRYFIAPDKLKEFEEYGRRWTVLIEKYGGTHLGYFIPEAPPAWEPKGQRMSQSLPPDGCRR